MRSRRRLLDLPAEATNQEMAELARDLTARYPEYAQYSEDQAEEFFLAANSLDASPLRGLLRELRTARIHVPPRVQTNAYHLSRHLMRRWWELRPALMPALVALDPRRVGSIRQSCSLAAVRELLDQNGPLATFWILKQGGMAEWVPQLLASLTEEEAALRRSVLGIARALLHRYLTEPEVWDQPTRKEQREAIRRIQRREIQLRSMRRSIYALSLERKSLVARARRAEREAEAELARLGARLEELPGALATAETGHAAAMAEEARRGTGEINALQAQLAASLQDFAAALVERAAWAPATDLAGLTVAVFGDQGRAAGYRVLVESLGGRFLFLSAVDKFQRVPEGAAAADILILITAFAKHRAEQQLRKAAAPGTLFLRCPNAGLAAFERVLRTETLPRVARRLAGTAARGGDCR